MAGEPRKGRGVIEIADRDFQIGASPGAFEMASRPGNALTQVAGSFALGGCFSPERFQKRCECPGLCVVLGALRQRAKQFFVAHLVFFVRSFDRALIEGELDSPRQLAPAVVRENWYSKCR